MLNGAYVGQSTPALLPSRSSETIREDPFAISGDSYIPNIPSPRPSLHRHKSFEIQVSIIPFGSDVLIMS